MLMLCNILIFFQLYDNETTKHINICDFTKEFLDICGVNTNTGAIFYPLIITEEADRQLTYECNKYYNLYIIVVEKYETNI